MKSVIGFFAMLTVLASSAVFANGVDSSGGGQAPGNDCTYLKGARFQSLRLYERGLGPNGPVLGVRTIVFSDTGLSIVYSLSDYSLRGGYRCEGKEAHVLTSLGAGREMNGAYDAQANVLYFDGVWFKRSP